MKTFSVSWLETDCILFSAVCFAGLHNYMHWQLCFCFTLDYKLKSLVILHSVHHSTFVCLCMYLKWCVLAVCSWSSKICVVQKTKQNSGNICQDLNNAHIFSSGFYMLLLNLCSAATLSTSASNVMDVPAILKSNTETHTL